MLLKSDCIDLKEVNKKFAGEQITPSVIEPSFGIGRILYSVLESSFYTRKDDNERGVFRFNEIIAPVKIAVICLL